MKTHQLFTRVTLWSHQSWRHRSCSNSSCLLSMVLIGMLSFSPVGLSDLWILCPHSYPTSDAIAFFSRLSYQLCYRPSSCSLYSHDSQRICLERILLGAQCQRTVARGQDGYILIQLPLLSACSRGLGLVIHIHVACTGEHEACGHSWRYRQPNKSLMPMDGFQIPLMVTGHGTSLQKAQKTLRRVTPRLLSATPTLLDLQVPTVVW